MNYKEKINFNFSKMKTYKFKVIRNKSNASSFITRLNYNCCHMTEVYKFNEYWRVWNPWYWRVIPFTLPRLLEQ